MRFSRSLAAFAVSSVIASNAWATNGYFSHGVGQKSKGMGGVGIALPQDSLAGGTNPAGMVLVGNRLDVGVEWFRPQREADVTGNMFFDGNYDGNDQENFFIPEFGYNRMMSDKWSLGVSVFGNGGMNSSYASPGFPMFNGGNGNKTGIDLMQLFVVPTLSYKINDQHSIGVGINLAGQWFRAQGLNQFDNGMFSSSPGNVSDNGHDSSFGAGLRIGWIGQLTDRFSLGATYQTKTWMSEFDDYEGLFAEQGDFDVPENYGIGLAFKATPKFVLAFDVTRINYSKINSVGNGGPTTNMNWAPMGSDNGAGFGWDDQTVYKLGAAYEINPAWTVRGGWNHADNPIPNDETLLNVLAPATVEDHLTLGATWTLKNKQEITFHYMHAFENKVKGSNSIPAGFGGGEADIKMYQDAFGIAWAMPLD